MGWLNLTTIPENLTIDKPFPRQQRMLSFLVCGHRKSLWRRSQMPHRIHPVSKTFGPLAHFLGNVFDSESMAAVSVDVKFALEVLAEHLQIEQRGSFNETLVAMSNRNKGRRCLFCDDDLR